MNTTTAIRTPDYDGPSIRVEWDMRPDEWNELRTVLLAAADSSPHIRHLIEDGAL